MVGLAGGGLLLRAVEVLGPDEGDGARELLALRYGGLGTHEGDGARVLLLVAAHPRLGDHEREVRGVELLAGVPDEAGQVLLVGVVEGLVDAIVPALVPADPQELDAVVLEIREARVDAGDRLAIQPEEVRVRGADLAARAGGAEVGSDALATPGDLDQQDGLVEVVPDDRAEAELRADLVLGPPEARPQGSVDLAASAEGHEHVLALDPGALRIDQVGEAIARLLVPDEALQGAAALVAPGGDDARADHVGLAREQEDLERGGGRRVDALGGEQGRGRGEEERELHGPSVVPGADAVGGSAPALPIGHGRLPARRGHWSGPRGASPCLSSSLSSSASASSSRPPLLPPDRPRPSVRTSC